MCRFGLNERGAKCSLTIDRLDVEVLKTNLEGVLLIKLRPFEDFRGRFVELWNKVEFNHLVWDVPRAFVEDDISMSMRNVLRGIHCDTKAWKLVSCLHGNIYLVVVNCDIESESFGKWQSFMLTGNSGVQIFIPPKYGIGHLVLSDEAVFWYKQSEYYSRERQETYAFDDERFNIYWPIQNPILSKRDEGVRRCHQEAQKQKPK